MSRKKEDPKAYFCEGIFFYMPAHKAQSMNCCMSGATSHEIEGERYAATDAKQTLRRGLARFFMNERAELLYVFKTVSYKPVAKVHKVWYIGAYKTSQDQTS